MSAEPAIRLGEQLSDYLVRLRKWRTAEACRHELARRDAIDQTDWIGYGEAR